MRARRSPLALLAAVLLACGCDRGPAPQTASPPTPRAGPTVTATATPQTEFAKFIAARWPDLTAQPPGTWEEFLKAGENLSPESLREIQARLRELGSAPFVSPVDYSAPGSVLLPHLEDLRVAYRAAMAVAVRGLADGDHEAATDALAAAAKAVTDLAGLPTLVESRAAIRLGTTLCNTLLGAPESAFSGPNTGGIADVIERVSVAIDAGGAGALAHMRDKYIDDVTNHPESLSDVSGVDVRRLEASGDQIARDLRSAFDALTTLWVSRTATGTEAQQAIAPFRKEGTRAFLAGLPRYFDDAAEYRLAVERLRKRLAR